MHEILVCNAALVTEEVAVLTFLLSNHDILLEKLKKYISSYSLMHCNGLVFTAAVESSQSCSNRPPVGLGG